ncbi:MAG: helix-turn-helix domain-containing protein, partial [Caulobacteraceae bacterium]
DLGEIGVRFVRPRRQDEGTAVKTTAKPGAMLKALRLRQGWTLAEVSARTGLPVSTLSKVENDKMSLSYDKLARISRGLEVDIGVLFATDAPPASLALVTGRRSITRAGDGRAIETRSYGHLYPATELLNKRFVPIVAEVRARSLAEFGEMIRHPGEEYAYVLEGAIDLHTDLYAPVRLETGDSIYFDSGMGHAYLAAAPGACRVLSICSGEESHLIAALGPDATPAKEALVAAAAPAVRKAGRRQAGSS